MNILLSFLVTGHSGSGVVVGIMLFLRSIVAGVIIIPSAQLRGIDCGAQLYRGRLGEMELVRRRAIHLLRVYLAVQDAPATFAVPIGVHNILEAGALVLKGEVSG